LCFDIFTLATKKEVSVSLTLSARFIPETGEWISAKFGTGDKLLILMHF
jgi:hypothetical protein